MSYVLYNGSSVIRKCQCTVLLKVFFTTLFDNDIVFILALQEKFIK